MNITFIRMYDKIVNNDILNKNIDIPNIALNFDFDTAFSKYGKSLHIR